MKKLFRSRAQLMISLGVAAVVILDRPVGYEPVPDLSPAASLSPATRGDPEDIAAGYRRLQGSRASDNGAPIAVARAHSFVKGRIIVAFEDGASSQDRRAVISSTGAREIKRLPGNIVVLRLPPRTRVAEARQALSPSSIVRFAEPDFVYRAAAVPDDPFFSQQWSLENRDPIALDRGGADIDAPLAWDATTGDDGVVVGVIDTGVAWDHPDLDGNIWANQREVAGVSGADDDGNGYVDDARGWDWVDDDPDPFDEQGHGTHVAGTIGAEGNNSAGLAGVNWDVSIMPLRVLGADGSGSTSDVAAAFAYAARAGARVVNASLSGPGRSQTLEAAISAAPDTLFVVAAGNEAADNDATPSYPCNYQQPNVMCVAATGRDDALAAFSNYGVGSVDLAAPGTRIVSTLPSIDQVMREGFIDLSRWITGYQSSWAIAADVVGNYITDSPTGPYAPVAVTSLTLADPIVLAAAQRCSLRYAMRLDSEPRDDVFRIQVSDGADWVTIHEWSGSTSNRWVDEVGRIPFSGRADLQIRFQLDPDGDAVVGDGVSLDDISVACVSSTYDGTEYAHYSGTSMATPHVAGAAAFLVAAGARPLAGELAKLLTAGADRVPGLTGKLTIGARLDLAGSLALLTPYVGGPSALPSLETHPTATTVPGGLGGFGATPSHESSPQPSAAPSEAGPSPSPSQGSETKTERALSLDLRRHLFARGRVTLPNGGDSRCRAHIVVQLLRGRNVVAETTTTADGSYRVRLRDRAGSYRARIRLIRFEDGSSCLRALSERRRHVH